MTQTVEIPSILAQAALAAHRELRETTTIAYRVGDGAAPHVAGDDPLWYLPSMEARLLLDQRIRLWEIEAMVGAAVIRWLLDRERTRGEVPSE